MSGDEGLVIVKQCPGCWSSGDWPADVDHECECGERLVAIDLRSGDNWDLVYGKPASPTPRDGGSQ